LPKTPWLLSLATKQELEETKNIKLSAGELSELISELLG